jgi:hypothetical protein
MEVQNQVVVVHNLMILSDETLKRNSYYVRIILWKLSTTYSTKCRFHARLFLEIECAELKRCSILDQEIFFQAKPNSQDSLRHYLLLHTQALSKTIFLLLQYQDLFQPLVHRNHLLKALHRSYVFAISHPL